jgi:hypothetical protein
MKNSWLYILALAAIGGIGWVWYKDRQNSSSGTTAAASTLNTLTPNPSTVDQNVTNYTGSGGLSYEDVVPVSVTSPTGFTAADYNYGAVNETPLASNGSYDVVAGQNQAGFTLVPTGVTSLNSYNQVVG